MQTWTGWHWNNGINQDRWESTLLAEQLWESKSSDLLPLHVVAHLPVNVPLQGSGCRVCIQTSHYPHLRGSPALVSPWGRSVNPFSAGGWLRQYPLTSLLDNCSGNKPHPVLKEEKGKGNLQEGRSRTDKKCRRTSERPSDSACIKTSTEISAGVQMFGSSVCLEKASARAATAEWCWWEVSQQTLSNGFGSGKPRTSASGQILKG